MADLVAATLFDYAFAAGSFAAFDAAAFIAANAAAINTVAVITASAPVGRPVWRPAALPPVAQGSACRF